MKKKTVAMEALLLQPNSEFCEERKCVCMCAHGLGYSKEVVVHVHMHCFR